MKVTKRLADVEDIEFGICGLNVDENGNPSGYIYHSDGYGNMETYCTANYLINVWGLDPNIEVALTYNNEGECIHAHAWV